MTTAAAPQTGEWVTLKASGRTPRAEPGRRPAATPAPHPEGATAAHVAGLAHVRVAPRRRGRRRPRPCSRRSTWRAQTPTARRHQVTPISRRAAHTQRRESPLVAWWLTGGARRRPDPHGAAGTGDGRVHRCPARAAARDAQGAGRGARPAKERVSALEARLAELEAPPDAAPDERRHARVAGGAPVVEAVAVGVTSPSRVCQAPGVGRQRDGPPARRAALFNYLNRAGGRTQHLVSRRSRVAPAPPPLPGEVRP